MKVKLNLYIYNPEAFAKDPTASNAYALQNGRWMDEEWIFASEIEFEVDADTKQVISAAKANLDDEIGKHTAAINVLENRKAELLALPYDGDQTQQDRTLSDGRTKTATGYVEDSTTTDLSDFPPDLGS